MKKLKKKIKALNEKMIWLENFQKESINHHVNELIKRINIAKSEVICQRKADLSNLNKRIDSLTRSNKNG